MAPGFNFQDVISAHYGGDEAHQIIQQAIDPSYSDWRMEDMEGIEEFYGLPSAIDARSQDYRKTNLIEDKAEPN